VPRNSPKAEVLNAVQRASAHSALVVHLEMKRGLHSLASIAFSAPLVGLLGTLWGIVGSFRGIAGERWSDYADIVNGLSQSLLPAALGILVAVIAFGGYRYFLDRLDEFDVEMKIASLQLIDQLAFFTKYYQGPHECRE
jgi:biopolymer transport protein ExbB/TolQ